MSENQTNQSTSNALAYVLVTVFIVLAGVVLFPLIPPSWLGARYGHHRAICLSNVKQLTIGSLMYAFDYNDTAMPRNDWGGVLFPYVKSETMFKCTELYKGPRELWGFAYNSHLSFVPIAKIAAPDAKPTIYDSELGLERF